LRNADSVIGNIYQNNAKNHQLHQQKDVVSKAVFKTK